MVILPAGSFMMGSDEHNSEKPIHQVVLKQFAISKYPVTQEQYQAVIGSNPSRFKENLKNPVESISWIDAQSFCRKIKKVPPQGAVYGNRLLANRWFPLQVYIFRPKGRGITPILD
jgi:formylglycine-generating enzyme required for sulfatase activity